MRAPDDDAHDPYFCRCAASVYTEMNAITKGVSLGLYPDGKQKGREASRTGSQPYVELMGRRSVLSLPSPSLPPFTVHPRRMDMDMAARRQS